MNDDQPVKIAGCNRGTALLSASAGYRIYTCVSAAGCRSTARNNAEEYHHA